jgi:hypothetical protein
MQISAKLSQRHEMKKYVFFKGKFLGSRVAHDEHIVFEKVKYSTPPRVPAKQDFG